MTSTTEPTTERPRVAPITCAPWCRDGDGHPGEWSEDDQRCTSEPVKLLRSLASQWEDCGGGWNPTEAEVFAQRGPTTPLAVVLYECGEQDYEVAFTPAEARALAARLIAAADLAEADG